MIHRSFWAASLDHMRGWRRDFPDAKKFGKPLRPTGIVIHHTEEDESLNRAPHQACVARLHHWFNHHVDQNHWSDIGYHFIICPHGEIFEARRQESGALIEGAHALNNNQATIGIALLGNYERLFPSAVAIGSLQQLLSDLIGRYGIKPRAPRAWNFTDEARCVHELVLPALVGHRDLRVTACPGDQLYELLGGFRDALSTGNL